jgi:hypothetical protein
MKQIILLLGVVMLTLSACTKTQNTLETTDILRGGKWKLSGYTAKFQFLGADTVVDIYKYLPECKKDDFLQFNANYKGIQNTGEKKCTSESTELPFDWELRNNNKILMLNNALYTTGKEYVDANLVKINKASFTITYEIMTEVMLPTKDTIPFYYTQTFIRM